MNVEFRESKDNPLHRDYGVLSNTAFLLGRIRKYCPKVFLFAPVNLACSSVLGYYWGFFGRFMIDLISSGKTVEEALPTLITILAAGLVSVSILGFLNEYSGTRSGCSISRFE